MARTFQNIRLFSDMTALENVMVGQHCRTHSEHPRGRAAHSAAPAREERSARDKSVSTCSSSSGSRALADELARNLPYGDQRRLEIARALATEPKLLLPRRAGGRHEPAGDGGRSMGLIRRIRDERHDHPAHRARHEGRHGRLATGSWCSTTARRSPRGRPRGPHDPKVIEAYLGQERLMERRSTAAAAGGRPPESHCSRSQRHRRLLRRHPRAAGHLARGRRAARSSPSSAPTAPARRTTLQTISGMLPAARRHDRLQGRRAHRASRPRGRQARASRRRPRAGGSSRA